jgi:hypothetical protein
MEKAWTLAGGLMVAACGTGSNGGVSAQCPGPGGCEDTGVGSDASSPGDATSGNGGQADAAAYLACFSTTGQLSAAIKSCQTDVDCVTKIDFTDCCGNMLYVGVSARSATGFDACEMAWRAHFLGRPCGPCPSPPAVAMTEDGQTLFDASSPQVHCASGECMTYLPGASADAGGGSAEAGASAD